MSESIEDPSTRDVVDNDGHDRFELVRGDERAVLDYRADDGRLVLVHTEVPESWRNQGIGGRLVQAAVTKAQREGLEIDARCSFAAAWIEQHQGP
jgi:uncharacterized protein